jgi:hypothetical protein
MVLGDTNANNNLKSPNREKERSRLKIAGFMH